MKKCKYEAKYKEKVLIIKNIYNRFYKMLSVHKVKFTQNKSYIYTNKHTLMKTFILLFYIKDSYLVNNLRRCIYQQLPKSVFRVIDK